MPIVPVGVGISRRKLMPTWDSYALPMPFCRCGLVFGDPLSVAAEADDAELRDMLKSALDRAECEARMLVGEEH